MIHRTYPIKDKFLSAQNLSFINLKCVQSIPHVTIDSTSVASLVTVSSPASVSSMTTFGLTVKNVLSPVRSNVARVSLKLAIAINMWSRSTKKLKSTLVNIAIRNLLKNTIGKFTKSQRKRNKFYALRWENENYFINKTTLLLLFMTLYIVL